MKTETKIRKQLLRLTLGLLVIGTTSAQAAEVFGLTFGKPLAIPECERDTSEIRLFDYKAASETTCFKTAKSYEMDDIYIDFPFKQRPRIIRRSVLQRDLNCILVGGKLERIWFETYGSRDIDLVLAALTTKYGAAGSMGETSTPNLSTSTGG